MKTTFSKITLAAALALALAFTLSCSSSDPNAGTGKTATYTGMSGGEEYTLSITGSAGGSVYELTVGGKTSTGTVSEASGSAFTLRPQNSGETFIAIVSEGNLELINGKVTWNDGTAIIMTVSFTFLADSSSSSSRYSSSSYSSSSSSSSSARQISSSSFDSCPNVSTGINTMTCGGQTYRTAKIGTQTWMAENLNYNAAGSQCYGEGDRLILDTSVPSSGSNWITISNAQIQANCATYGRLYYWGAAMGACPHGWHLPSNEEWSELETAVGGSSTAARYLKSTSLWKPVRVGLFASYSNVTLYNNGYDETSVYYFEYDGEDKIFWGNNTDDKYGFSALPGSYQCDFYLRGTSPSVEGDRGYWWTSTDYGFRNMTVGSEVFSGTNDFRCMFSVRCIKD
ncbi:MAG: hypothetical protein LBH25_08785 [Fibromonadaceae bacterium]|jgi:hypothetical protein|nr:hypothetical protein [Fibromonadaceae bacterium]